MLLVYPYALLELIGKDRISLLFFCGQEYVAHFEFLKNVWFRIKRAAVASRRATNLATHLPLNLATHLPFNLAPISATHCFALRNGCEFIGT